MYPPFIEKRLHVGFRGKDWSPVWYEPDLQQLQNDPEGEADIMLYKLTVGEPGRREPMEGEVFWHPHFDPNNFQSKKVKERERMQKQFLADAYKYMLETNPKAIRKLEKELHQPKYRHWQSWFEMAKEWKKTIQLREEAAVREEREDAARQARRIETELKDQVTSGTSDEAYETDDERATRSPSEMPPPPRPGSQKRKINNTNVRNPKAANKRQATASSTGSSGLFMHGANGSRTPSARPSPSIRSNTTGLDDNVDGFEEYDDEIMDIRDPNEAEQASQQPQPPPYFTGLQNQWGFGMLNTPPPSGLRLGSEPNRKADRGYNYIDPSRSVDGLDDQALEERARRHEQEQEDLNMSDDEAVQHAIRASMEPESVQGDVVESTEVDDEDAT